MNCGAGQSEFPQTRMLSAKWIASSTTLMKGRNLNLTARLWSVAWSLARSSKRSMNPSSRSRRVGCRQACRTIWANAVTGPAAGGRPIVSAKAAERIAPTAKVESPALTVDVPSVTGLTTASPRPTSQGGYRDDPSWITPSDFVNLYVPSAM